MMSNGMLRACTITNTQACLDINLTIMWNEIHCKIIYTCIIVCVFMKYFKNQDENLN